MSGEDTEPEDKLCFFSVPHPHLCHRSGRKNGPRQGPSSFCFLHAQLTRLNLVRLSFVDSAPVLRWGWVPMPHLPGFQWEREGGIQFLTAAQSLTKNWMQCTTAPIFALLSQYAARRTVENFAGERAVCPHSSMEQTKGVQPIGQSEQLLTIHSAFPSQPSEAVSRAFTSVRADPNTSPLKTPVGVGLDNPPTKFATEDPSLALGSSELTKINLSLQNLYSFAKLNPDCQNTMYFLAEKLLLSLPGLTLTPEYYQVLGEMRTIREQLVPDIDSAPDPESAPDPDSAAEPDSAL